MNKKQKATAKKMKYDTKRLGFWIIINSLVWGNTFIGLALAGKPIPEPAKDITIALLALGIILLLGRKFIGEFITMKFGGKVSGK